jgi:hypothetical protein
MLSPMKWKVHANPCLDINNQHISLCSNPSIIPLPSTSPTDINSTASTALCEICAILALTGTCSLFRRQLGWALSLCFCMVSRLPLRVVWIIRRGSSFFQGPEGSKHNCIEGRRDFGGLGLTFGDVEIRRGVAISDFLRNLCYLLWPCDQCSAPACLIYIFFTIISFSSRGNASKLAISRSICRVSATLHWDINSLDLPLQFTILQLFEHIWWLANHQIVLRVRRG